MTVVGAAACIRLLLQLMKRDLCEHVEVFVVQLLLEDLRELCEVRVVDLKGL